jgi:hypothetical protein
LDWNDPFGNKIKLEMFRNLLVDEIKKNSHPKEVDDVIKTIQN